MRTIGWYIGAAAAFAATLVATLACADDLRSVGLRVADAPPSALDEQQLKLRGLQTTIEGSDDRRKALAGEIAGYTADRARFETELLAVTRTTADDEAKLATGEARLGALTGQEETAKRALAGRQAVVADVLAALQRMGRRLPPALLVEPEDVLKAMRTSMLLGAVLPEMRLETEALIANLRELTDTRTAIERERQTLSRDLAELGRQRTRLAAMIDVRQMALGKAQADLEAERDKAKQLAEQAGSLKDLIGRMERDSATAAQAAEAAHLSDRNLAALMPDGAAHQGPAAAKDPARLAPAVAFATTKGMLQLPVSGAVLRRFGEDDGLGSNEKGMLITTVPAAVVASPADGWIAYAGPYRSFGQLLILNVGGGYYIVLAGMDRVNVSLGQFVLAGEPVASMGDGSVKTAAAVALGAAQPVLYVEFRKDGATIDPGPWWAKPEIQKVRG